MLVRLRIALPDRPGSLGRVTSALGLAGADIAAVRVLESESGRALDDVVVNLHDRNHLRRVTAEVNAVPGVEVIASQWGVPPVTGHADLELAAQVLERAHTGPAEALGVLVDGAPGALGADWAALLEYRSPDDIAVRLISPGGPAALTPPSVPLRTLAVSLDDGQGALVPLNEGSGAGVGLLLVRGEGPQFHLSELWRLGQFGRLLGSSIARFDPVPCD